MGTRMQALKLYLEGLGFRAIGRILNVSNVTVDPLQSTAKYFEYGVVQK